MPEKTPQDHKKPAKDAGHPFAVKGKTYTLPPIDEAAATKVPGGITADAVMYPDDNTMQMRLAFFMLDVVNTDPETRTALRSLPTDEMLEVIGEWMGGSSASSD